MSQDRLITVCADCKMATCWYGLFMCESSRGANVIFMTISELEKLNLEHPSYWTLESVVEVR